MPKGQRREIAFAKEIKTYITFIYVNAAFFNAESHPVSGDRKMWRKMLQKPVL